MSWPCFPWIRPRSIPTWHGSVRSTTWRYGVLLRALGSQCSAGLGRPRWMRVGSGKTRFGRTFGRNATFVSSSKQRALTRGESRVVFPRLAADRSFLSRALLGEVQIRVTVYLAVYLPTSWSFGPIPVDLYMWQGDQNNLDFAQAMSISD